MTHEPPALPEEPDRALEHRLGEYLLNPEHEEGRHKLKLFEARFGIGAEDRGRCATLLVEASRGGVVEGIREREDCSLYAFRADIRGSDGEMHEMRIVWKVPHGTDEWIFITAYPAPPAR